MKNSESCTIYLLKNNVNGKVYVGQTWNSLQKRMGPKGTNYKNSIYLYNAIKKYGINKFNYEVLAQCNNQKVADYLEDYYINEFNSRNFKVGYNLKTGGSSGRHSEETKLKISNTLKQQSLLWSSETLYERSKIISNYWRGKRRGPQTQEQKQSNSDFFKKWHSENIHPMKGKHHTEDSKAKIGAAAKGRKMSLESVQKSAIARMMDKNRESEIINAYQSGKTIDYIEDMFNTSRSSIYRVLGRNNISRQNNRNIVDDNLIKYIKQQIDGYIQNKIEYLEKSILLSNNLKRCTKCNDIQHISEFSKRTDGGLFSWCKNCINAYRRASRSCRH